MSTAEELHASDGPLPAQRDAPVGGQAVLEGVMMRGVRHWAVAVRRPAEDGGAVDVHVAGLDPWVRRHRLYRLPVVRGVVALAESLSLGFKAIAISANAREEEEIPAATWTFAVVAGLALAVGLFFVVPVTLTSLVKGWLDSAVLFWLVEGAVRTAIFIGYLWALSHMRDLRRLFQYHGAEHQTIACYEAGDDLVPARAALYSRLHPRCGTSFMLVVMVVAVFVFAPVGLPAWYLLVATRILGVPLIAGISFELIKAAGRNRSRRWVRALMWPGMQLQRLTTDEPDREQLAVAIAALRAVLEREDPRGAGSADRVGMEVVA